MAEKKRGLGRGFESLIPTQMVEAEFDVTAAGATDESAAPNGQTSRVGESLREVNPALVDPNPHQPRTDFDAGQLEALAASIRVHGILQPMVVTRQGSRYELIAGERRLRAAKIAGLDRVPVIVRSFDEQEKLELAIIENLQRAELNPIEVATAYRKLVDQFNMTNHDIARRVGRDHSAVSNSMRLLNLPLEAKRAVVAGRITEGHARVLLTTGMTEDKQLELLGLMEKNNWTVRQSEEYARAFRARGGTHETARARIAQTNTLTQTLGDFLGTKVTQQTTAKGGRLVIEYYSEEELDRIYRTIRREAD